MEVDNTGGEPCLVWNAIRQLIRHK